MIIGIIDSKVAIKKDTSFTLNDSVHIQGLVNASETITDDNDSLAILVPNLYGKTFKVSVGGTQVDATWSDDKGAYLIKTALTQTTDTIISADAQQV